MPPQFAAPAGVTLNRVEDEQMAQGADVARTIFWLFAAAAMPDGA